MSKTETYYWNLKNQTFGGRKFGEDVTDLLTDQPKRREEFLKLGKIATSEPIDFDHAKETELSQLRKLVGQKDEEIASLKVELKKKPKTSKAAKAAIEKTNDLEDQIEELTGPDKKGGK